MDTPVNQLLQELFDKLARPSAAKLLAAAKKEAPKRDLRAPSQTAVKEFDKKQEPFSKDMILNHLKTLSKTNFRAFLSSQMSR